MSPVHVREKPPLRHMIDVKAPGGRHYRLGEDEPDPANVFSGLRYSDTMPGGFEAADCTLPREPGAEYPDLERLSDWRVLGVGGEPYWEGRLERVPRTSGDEVSVSPSAAGWQAHLDDDKSAKEIYVDTDLTHWGEPSRARVAQHLALALPFVDSDWSTSVAPDPTAGTPSLVQQTGRLVSTAARIGVAEHWYNANGIPLDGVSYMYASNLGGPAAAWVTQAVLCDDDTGTNTNVGTDHDGTAGPVAGSVLSSGVDKTYCVLITRYEAVFTGDGTWTSYWHTIGVFGNHGLTGRANPAGASSPFGFYASDIVGHAVARFAPLLQVKPDSIQQSSFVVTQMAFLEPTTCAEIVRQASRFHLPDWAVWNDKEFVWHQPGERGRTWRLRIGPSQLEETGPQVDRVWESVIVSYQDVDGSTRTVGPPGSGADTESADLKDSDPDNPANKLGLTRRDILAMGVSTSAGATEVGRLFLEQARLLDRSGKARVVGWAEDDRGVTHPFAAIRSGDYAVFVDAADTSPRKIVRTDKDYDSRTCTLDLDAPPEGLQQLLERLGVVLVPLGL